jgi:uncharacterized membrane protein YeiB
MSDEQKFMIFFCTWIGLALCGFLAFSLNKNAQIKRKYFPIYVVGIGIAFIGFVHWMFPPEPRFLIVYPAIALISFLNIKMTKFCDECGKTNFPRNAFSALKFCQKCGASLEKR